MKVQYFLLAVWVTCYACHKPPGQDNPTLGDTPVPPVTTMSSGLIVYAYPGSPITNPADVFINNDFATKGYACSFSNQFTTDKYNTRTYAAKDRIGLSFQDNERVIAVSSPTMNYVDIKVIAAQDNRDLDRSQGEIWDLPGGCKLTTTPNCFINSVDASLGIPAYVAYVDPGLTDFGITMPAFFGDVDQKRSFLRSFGLLRLDLFNYWNIRPNADVKLFIPVPTSLTSQAPDSIEAWLFKSDKWIFKGYAAKSGNGYTKKIDDQGLWTFASRVKGLYMTLKVRTENNIPVINAGIKIKSGPNVVAAGRTDADGDLICFLPANEGLNLEMTGNYYGSIPSFSKTLGSFQSAGDIPVQVATNSSWLTAIKGTVNACNGAPLPHGIVSIRDVQNFYYGHMTVTNGQYSGAVLINNQISALRAFSSAEVGRDSGIVLTRSVENVVNLTTCLPVTGLYLNYSVDGVNNSLVGDWATSNNPFLNGYLAGNPLIACTSGNSGIQFYSPIALPGSFTSISSLWVNGAFRNVDQSKPVVGSFTRCDLLVGGFIEGKLDVYYLEGSLSRHLVASFRVKRIT